MASRFLDFNKLSRSSRERFTNYVNGKNDDTPIFSHAPTTSALVGWIVLALASLGTTVLLIDVNYGTAYHFKQTPDYVFAYAASLFLFTLAVVGMIRRIRMKKEFPFRTGTYVFPLDLVIAKSKTLEIFSMSDVTKTHLTDHYRNGSYTFTEVKFCLTSGRSIAFNVSSRYRVNANFERLSETQQRLRAALANGDMRTIAALDPFFELRTNNWVEAPQPADDLMAGDLPRWMQRGWQIGLGVSVLAVPLLYVRNVCSDNAVFHELTSAIEKVRSGIDANGFTDTWMWTSYAKESRHADELRTLWMPKLELIVARRNGTPEAIQEFLNKYAGSPVESAAREALAEAYHNKFVGAHNNISALRDFIRDYPAAADVPNAKSELHEAFAKAIAEFRPRANPNRRDVIPFMESLIQFQEEHGSPDVEVRFRRRTNASLAAADRILAEAYGKTAGVAAVSSYFDENSMHSREDILVKALQDAFSSVFPTEVLRLKLSDPANAEVPSQAAPERATIFIDYEVGWSGESYEERESKRKFVGIKLVFNAVIHAPTHSKDLAFTLTVAPPKRFTVTYNDFAQPRYQAAFEADSKGSDAQVYNTMALRAFDQLSVKLSEVFFQDPVQSQSPAVAPIGEDADDGDGESE